MGCELEAPPSNPQTTLRTRRRTINAEIAESAERRRVESLGDLRAYSANSAFLYEFRIPAFHMWAASAWRTSHVQRTTSAKATVVDRSRYE